MPLKSMVLVRPGSSSNYIWRACHFHIVTVTVMKIWKFPYFVDESGSSTSTNIKCNRHHFISYCDFYLRQGLNVFAEHLKLSMTFDRKSFEVESMTRSRFGRWVRKVDCDWGGSVSCQVKVAPVCFEPTMTFITICIICCCTRPNTNLAHLSCDCLSLRVFWHRADQSIQNWIYHNFQIMFRDKISFQNVKYSSVSFGWFEMFCPHSMYDLFHVFPHPVQRRTVVDQVGNVLKCEC